MFTNQSKCRPKHSLQLEIRCRKDTVALKVVTFVTMCDVTHTICDLGHCRLGSIDIGTTINY